MSCDKICSVYSKLVIIGGIITAAFFSFQYLGNTYTPIIAGNSLLVQTTCSVVNSSVITNEYTFCDCIAKECKCETTLWYRKVNVYSFPLISKNQVTHESDGKSLDSLSSSNEQSASQPKNVESTISFDWSLAYPMNDIGQVVTCYYNKCVFDNTVEDCDPSPAHTLTFSKYKANENQVFGTIICVAGTLPVVIPALFCLVILLRLILSPLLSLCTVNQPKESEDLEESKEVMLEQVV